MSVLLAASIEEAIHLDEVHAGEAAKAATFDRETRHDMAAIASRRPRHRGPTLTLGRVWLTTTRGVGAV